MLTIKINENPIEIQSDFSITMNLKSPIFNEPGSYSYPFKIPNTPRNSIQLGFRHRVSNTNNIFQEFSGAILWNGINLFTGTMKIKLVDADSYEGYMLEGNGDFNYQRKKSSLQDIDFGSVEFNTWQEKIEYVNGCLGKFYPERNFCFTQIENKSYFETLPANPVFHYFNYYKDSVIQYYYNGPTVIVPMLYFKYVLSKLFETLQYKLSDDFFSNDPDFNSLVLFNSVDCNEGNEGFFKYDPTKILLNYHVPRISMNDFLTGLESFFNLRIFVNCLTKTVKLKSVDQIVKSAEVINFSDKIISVSTEPEDKITGFRLSMDMQTDDAVFESMSALQETLLKRIKPSVTSIADLKPWPASNFDTRWVEEEENYYILNSDKVWVPISGNYWTWNLFSKWIYKNDNQSIETKFSTLMSENVHPYNAIVGAKREEWEDVSPKLFFVRLQDDGALGKRMSGRCFVADQYANVSNNLFYGGENGLLNKYYKTYFDFRMSTKLVKIVKNMSFSELQSFDFSKKYMINGVKYLIKNIQVVIKRDRIMPATLECYPCP